MGDIAGVKERGMLYKGEMVRALMRDVDPKTQTRRVIKPQPSGKGEHGLEPNDVVYDCIYNPDPPHMVKLKECRGRGMACAGWLTAHPYSPYGKPGDRLWVRETWQVIREHNELWLVDKGVTCHGRPMKIKPDYAHTVVYRCDDTVQSIDSSFCWRSSMFMPRWASRIDLEVIEIRVQRIQDISAMDAVAEGIVRSTCSTPAARAINEINAFHALWDSINSAPKPCYKTIDGVEVITHYVSYPWEDVQETRTHRGKPWHVYGNPWVWVIEFKRIK